MNDLMSLGLHRVWKEQFVNLMELNSKKKVLDLATGSGDLIKLIKKKSDCICIGYDPNINMIKEAKKKLANEKVSFVNGFAENIPFQENSFELVTVSFGLRNFSNIEKSLLEIKRVLKKGHKFYCLEFSQINSFFFRKIFNSYSRIIPLYGNFFASNKEAYSYLIESIHKFPNQIELTKKLISTGFKNIEVFDVLDGLASIHISEI